MPVFVFCLSKRHIKRIYCVGACMSWRWLPPRIFSCTSLEWRYRNFARRWPIFLGCPTYYRLWFYYSASIKLLSAKNIRLFLNIKNVCCLNDVWLDSTLSNKEKNLYRWRKDILLHFLSLPLYCKFLIFYIFSFIGNKEFL